MDGPPTPPPLASYTQEVLATLISWLDSADAGLPVEELTSRLDAEGFEPATIDAAVEQLLNRGYLYEVDGKLRLTDNQA